MKKIKTTKTIPEKIASLKEHSFSVGIYHVADIDILADSLQTHGQIHPILIDKERRIVSGRRRWFAAKQLGWENIQVQIINDLTEQEIEQLIVASNQQRKKTFFELLAEARFVLGTLGTSQGKERELIGLSEEDALIAKDRFDLAAKYINADFSGRTLRKLLHVDNFEKENPSAGLGLIDKIGKGSMTIDRAYKLIEQHKQVNTEGLSDETMDPAKLSQTKNWEIFHASCRNMHHLKDGSVQMIATSPPYWGLRDYRDEAERKLDTGETELGQEKSVEEYLDNITAHLFEMKRVLHDRGSIFINIGDTYDKDRNHLVSQRLAVLACDVVGLHFVNEIIFSKENNLPHTVPKRLQPSFEKIFHFTKTSDYDYYPFKVENAGKKSQPYKIDRANNRGGMDIGDWHLSKPYKKFRDFITVQDQTDIIRHCTVQVEAGAVKKLCPNIIHRAPFSVSLMLLPLLCTTKPGDLTLDPFGGSGSFLITSVLMGRKVVMYEKQEKFVRLANIRILRAAKEFNSMEAEKIEALATEQINITHFANSTEQDTNNKSLKQAA